MRLTAAGIERINQYKGAVERIKDSIIAEKTSIEKEGKKIQGVALALPLALAQCDAAIQIATDLIAHLPLQYPDDASWFTRNVYTADNVRRLGLLMTHLRPGGSYARAYDALNGNSGAWAVNIASSAGMDLAKETATLTKDLLDNLDGTYFQVDRDLNSSNIILLSGVASGDPLAILRSALTQMTQTIDFWNNHLSRRPSVDECYASTILHTLNISFNSIIEKGGISDEQITAFMLSLGLGNNLINEQNKKTFGTLLSNYCWKIEDAEKKDLDKRLRIALLELVKTDDFDRSHKVFPLSKELSELKAAILAIHTAQNENDINAKKFALGQMLATMKNYYIALSMITHKKGLYEEFSKLHNLEGIHSSIISQNDLLLNLFRAEPLISKGFLNKAEEISNEKISRTDPRAVLNEWLQSDLLPKIENYQKTHPDPSSVQKEKINILDELMNVLLSLTDYKPEPSQHAQDHQKYFRDFFTRLIQAISLKISKHNQLVNRYGSALGTTNDILQDSLKKAIELFNGYTLGCNIELVNSLRVELSSSPENKSLLTSSSSNSLDLNENKPDKVSSLLTNPSFFSLDENNVSNEKEKENEKKKEKKKTGLFY